MLDANVGDHPGPRCRRPGRHARIVYTSTVNVLGNTHGEVVDETHRRDLAEGFLSYYDLTKYQAHELVRLGSPAGRRS